jgi:predicted dehydrogenase
MEKIEKNLSRRNFIKSTSAGVTGIVLVPTILSSCAKGANDRILIAHIGVGSRGQDTMKNYFVPLETSFSVATCDPFQQRRNASADYIRAQYREKGVKAPKCTPYLHFREVLERSDIDAVHISTPDHWHVPLAVEAARAGKHIYLEKPLGLSYPNFKILEKEVKTNDVRFHYGTQQRSMRHIQLGIDMIKDGKIGEIERVEVWAPGYNPVESPVCQEVPVPDDFDYDLWTGPAPLNSYCPDRVTNNSSWFQWDYSIGFLAGWGAHPLDVMIWALKDKLNGNYTCEGTGKYWEPGGIYNNIRAWDLNYVYDSGIQMHFFDTDFANENNLLHYRNLKEGNGTTFYGTKGWISLSRSSAQSNISDLDRQLNYFPQYENGWIRCEENTMGQLFVDVIKGNIPEVCPLDDAIISDCVSHIGNMAIRTGRKITWNPLKGELEDDQEATSWFIREMRKPYTI